MKTTRIARTIRDSQGNEIEVTITETREDWSPYSTNPYRFGYTRDVDVICSDHT